MTSDESGNTDRTPPAGVPTVNGLAVASLILGIIWVMWVGSILALVFGYVARSQIDRSEGAESGRGLAVAGIVLGWIGIGTLAVVATMLVTGVLSMPSMSMMNAPGSGADFASNGQRIYTTATSDSGQRITYEEGPEDGMMEGRLACVDCHGADGRGGERQMMMETFHAPDIRWSTLSDASYTSETVKDAITQGIGSGGRTLSPIMPRWEMSEEDLTDLVEYLRTVDEN